MAPNRRLKQARELRGWSQAKVADKIGTDATTVSRWERGIFSPTPYFRERLCKLFSRNAEELGLLETSDQPPEREQVDFFLQPPISLPSFQATDARQKEDSSARNTVALLPPSWPRRTDTFSYILHSVAYDQQAHMLWGDAYVQALRGQHAEAQQLGEASLSAFERVGHLNAAALREWLAQRDLLASPPSPANVPPTPLPVHSDQHELPAGRFVRGRGVGITLILMVIVALLLTGFSFNQLSPTPRVALPVAHALSVAKPEARATPTSWSASNSTPTPVPSFTITAQVSPASITSQDCSLEALGYRCTLTLSLYTTDQGRFTWHVSTRLPAQFGLTTGTLTPGQPLQLIVYIKSSPRQTGQFLFTFTSGLYSCTTFATWEG